MHVKISVAGPTWTMTWASPSAVNSQLLVPRMSPHPAYRTSWVCPGPYLLGLQHGLLKGECLHGKYIESPESQPCDPQMYAGMGASFFDILVSSIVFKHLKNKHVSHTPTLLC